MTKSEIISRYLGSYETGDRDTIEKILAEEFSFKSPQNVEFDRKTYFEKCWPMSISKPVINIESICENGHEAFALYNCEIDGKKFRNTEYIKFNGEKITSIEVFFGIEFR